MVDQSQSDRVEQEAAWVAQALAGDPKGFEALVRRYRAPVERLSRAIVRNPQDAEDLLQETFLRAYRYLHRFDSSRPFGPWIMRIGTNLARNLLRHRRARPEVSLDETLDGEKERFEGEWVADFRSVAEMDYRHLVEQTQRVLATLAEEQRVVLEMRLLGEMSYKEIASAVGVPIGTVMSRLSRGRKQIQAELREFAGDGEELPRAQSVSEETAPEVP